ncbi:histidine phosphatase family protein [Gilvimarinus algae]|uniref:Histidine phosphatase family protein n=1 Tax=Gilvimarinus algae TaxID=3058037 RepID=A0ABT8TGJ5_9GAMM|nr:histidine phosphatase family protein [Gilvimarinus sp. SDUM040014]MDO3381806.1 histidine phosphatase family protein [Gilvimarinus sp. SDUM040014]
MQIDVLRHGECEGGRIFRGHIDVALTATGRAQMREGVAQLAGPWQRIVSSPLVRCRSFAETLAAQTGVPVEIEPAIKEVGYGQWEGQSVEAVWREQQALCLAWSRAPDKTGPPGGEPFHDFRARVLTALAQSAAIPGADRILWITHGGVIKLLLSMARQMPPAGMMQLTVGYGFAASVQTDGDNLRVLYPQESEYVYQP